MKKFIKTNLVLFASLAALAGCEAGPKQEGEKKGHFTHDVTIKFSQAYAGGYQATLQDMLDSFAEKEPYVKIDLASGWISGNYDTIHTNTNLTYQ